MEDRFLDAQTPAEEDPAVHRALATLPAFAPGPVFENRVMSRVWRPLPPKLRELVLAWQDYVDSGRVYGPLGALAVGALIPLGAAIALVATFSSQIGSFLVWLVGVGIPFAWAMARADIAEVVATVNTYIAALFPSGTALMATAIGSVLVLAGCTFGLYRTMNPRGAMRHSR
jgi:hypothetical protein